MKRIERPWKASISPRYYILSLIILLNILATSSTYASGAKLPEIASDEQTIDATPTENPTSPTGDDTSTTPSTGGVTIPPPPTGGVALPTETILASLNRPWTKNESSIVIDAYEGNSIDWAKMASDKKVVGVIHRSSIGMRVDKLYQSRKKIALERGYLWGAYHLGYRGNTIAQANLFLSLVADEPDTLMILDLENTSAGNMMSIDEAVVFMNHIYEKTGRIPTVYANHSTTLLLNQKVKSNPQFIQAKLWYARFKENVTDFPKGIWPNYFLWQFSSELNCSTTGSCLYNVPGTKFDMDVNVFYGSATELAARWNNN